MRPCKFGTKEGTFLLGGHGSELLDLLPSHPDHDLPCSVSPGQVAHRDLKVTEQLDALRAMGSDPIRVLVVPRFVACVVMTPILTIYSDILGSWGAWLVVVRIFEVPGADYWYHTANFVTWWEPAGGLAKSLFFGACIGLASCYKGFFCRPGAAGVGRAATSAFVSSFIAIIMINLVLAHFLNTFRMMVDPNENSFFF